MKQETVSKGRVLHVALPYFGCLSRTYICWLADSLVRSLIGEPKIDISALVIGEHYSVNYLTEV